MSGTPLNVFGRSDDAEGVARFIAGALEGSALKRDDKGFHVTSSAKRRLRRTGARAARQSGGHRAPDVVVNVSPAHFEGDAGEAQRAGLANFVRTRMKGPGLQDVLAMAPDLRLVVAFVAEDPLAPDGQDALFRLAFSVAAAADGFVMSIGHGAIWSPTGDVLASVDHEEPAEEESGDEDVPAEPRPPSDREPGPPSPGRVVLRLLALTAVAARALEEAENQHLAEARQAILAWVDGLGITGELEPGERRLLEAAPGAISHEDQAQASWRMEGAGVLAWALTLIDLPPHDEPVDPAVIVDAVGFPDPNRTTEVFAQVALRPDEEIQALAEQLFAVHWRLREQSLRPRTMDFAGFARTAWFGPLELDGVRLVDGDLAIGDRPLDDADPNGRAVAMSAVGERHLAANWLEEGGVYSDTDTST